jgi:dGTPase
MTVRRGRRKRAAWEASSADSTSACGAELGRVWARCGITYDAHDTDDALKLGLVSMKELREIPLIRELAESLEDRFGPLEGKRLRKALVHSLIDRQVTSLLEAAERFLATHSPTSADEARRTEFRFEVDGDLARRKRELEAFLYQRVYRHPQVVSVRREAQTRLQTMFEGYVRRLELLPVRFQERADRTGIRRAVGDYVAGMTDRFCDEQYRKKFAP